MKKKAPAVGKRIPLKHKVRGHGKWSQEDDCENPYIQLRKTYLVQIDGSWYAGQFSKQWYGWNFNEGPYDAGCQLDQIDAVYELAT